jgi:LysM repeat protein
MRTHAQISNPSRQKNAAPLARQAPPQNARPAHPSPSLSSAPGLDLSHVPVRATAPFQAKLTVGKSGDQFEREADRIAEQVMRRPDPRAPSEPGAAVRGQAAAPARTQIESSKTNDTRGPPAPSVVHEVLRSPGQPLDTSARAFMEPRFGRDFSNVRVHTDSTASHSAQTMNALAYTVGNNAVFAQGHYVPGTRSGLRLLAHELAHVTQQSSGAHPLVQRYEAGEHTQFGQTGPELKSLINAPQARYTVGKGESASFIAKAFNVPVEELLERNKNKVKTFRSKSDKSKKVRGFWVGEVIEIPPVRNEAMNEALKTDELSYKAGQPDGKGERATVRYGQGIAMGGDLYGKPDDIDNDSKSSIENIDQMIDKEEAGSKKTTKEWIDNADWDKATNKRFVGLALANESHFSPSNPAFAPATHAGSANNKSEWEGNHTTALKQSQGGAKDKALEINAFADHFLTDAFSAGHLVNKLDVMEKFKSGITIKGPGPMTKDSELTPQSTAFFDQISGQAFPGDVSNLYSGYETVERHWGFHPNIDSVGMFSKLLQGIYTTQPDLIAGSVAKSVHDDLNTKAGGVEVENDKGDKWQLSGDKTLNSQTLDIGHKAVAQSQYNVLSVFKSSDKLDLPQLFKAVWDYVPHATATGTATVKSSVDKGTDVSSAPLVTSIVRMIKENYRLILQELVKRGLLKKA